MKSIALVLVFSIAGGFTGLNPACLAQTRTAKADVFEKIEMLAVSDDHAQRKAARLRFETDSLIVESRKSRAIMKQFRYSEILSADYSYSKHPRWKAGAGTAAGSFLLGPLFPLLLPFVIPLAFSKSRRHWLTVRTHEDYLVLRLDKNNRQVVLPAFEVRTGIKVETVGEK
jgi:hypothetical protein